jgi:hypothetical protein
MIQRIQTLFLLAAVALQILILSLPLAHFILPEINVKLFSIGFKEATEEADLLLATSPLYILCWAILVLKIITIFLYKKRILQIRFCIYTILLNVGLIGMLILSISNFLKNNPVDAHNYTAGLVIPLANIILLYLAFRGIRKDELLIKAYERLR